MYQPVIGLEIHLQAKTKSKMFCRCDTDYFHKQPNTNICPVCFGLPGALPVPNEEAINKCIKLALALNCSINQNTKFDRKNYFYPDLPKGYQISQYDVPIGEKGYLEIDLGDDSKRIRITRVHMEEDTAKSIHDIGNETLIDYNKSGIPLIEIVTEPDFQNVEEVLAFAKRLRQLVRYAEISDAEMQKGQMRFELNMSLRTENLKEHELPNYRIEVKNIGSISVLEKVIKFEQKRQGEELDKGEKIKNQTRGLKGMTGETVLQRVKESADDYRYFPEPDIPPIIISQDTITKILKEMPELPHERKTRYLSYGLEPDQAEVFVEDRQRGDWFDATRIIVEKKYKELLTLDSRLLTNIAKWINTEIAGQLEKKKLDFANCPVEKEDLIYLLKLIEEKQITASAGKKVIDEIFKTGEGAEHLIKKHDLVQISDQSAISSFVEQVIKENEKVVNDIKKNPNALKYLVGQVMRLSKGKTNPNTAEALLKEKIGVQ